MFETQKSESKTSSGEIGLDIRTHASPKVGQDQVSGGVSVLCWHAANILWKSEQNICRLSASFRAQYTLQSNTRHLFIKGIQFSPHFSIFYFTVGSQMNLVFSLFF